LCFALCCAGRNWPPSYNCAMTIAPFALKGTRIPCLVQRPPSVFDILDSDPPLKSPGDKEKAQNWGCVCV
jgi:hypothetical protein